MENKEFINTTPKGLFQDAEDFFYAYRQLKKTRPHQLRLLKIEYYLLGHALELVFKSFLLENGVGLKCLKCDIKHNISRCLGLSKQKGINIINKKEAEAVEQLNHYYQDKQFEYSKDGILNLPSLKAIENIIVKLLNLLRRDFS